MVAIGPMFVPASLSNRSTTTCSLLSGSFGITSPIWEK